MKAIAISAAIIFIFSLDFTKSKIGSFNHQTPIPGYLTDVELEGSRMYVLFGEPVTLGIIPKDSLNAFYKAINGIDSFSIPVESDSFGGAYRNGDDDIDGVWFESLDADHYSVVIKSFYD